MYFLRRCCKARCFFGIPNHWCQELLVRILNNFLYKPIGFISDHQLNANFSHPTRVQLTLNLPLQYHWTKLSSSFIFFHFTCSCSSCFLFFNSKALALFSAIVRSFSISFCNKDCSKRLASRYSSMQKDTEMMGSTDGQSTSDIISLRMVAYARPSGPNRWKSLFARVFISSTLPGFSLLISIIVSQRRCKSSSSASENWSRSMRKTLFTACSAVWPGSATGKAMVQLSLLYHIKS